MSAGVPLRVEDLIDGALMARLDALDVTSRKIFQGKVHGERRSRRRGQSVEFADFRPYVAGDDLRFVDWNIYARLDRLFLKLFLDEEDLTLAIALDCSGSMDWGDPNKFLYARKVAMALGYVGLVNHNRVGLFGFNELGVLPLTGLRGRRRTRELGQWLIARTAEGDAGFDAAMRTIATGRQGRGVLIVLSDFLLREGCERGLRAVSGRGCDVYALQVLSPQERSPGQFGITGDLRFIDCEDQSEVEMTISTRTLAQYSDALVAHATGLRDFCVRRGIVHVPVPTTTPVDELLLDYLRKRGLLR